MHPIHTILHPTDLSTGSGFAFQMACSLAKDYNARLVLLHVVPPVTAPLLSESPPEPLEKRFPWPQAADPKVRVEHQVVEGNAPEEILRLAENIHCDLIVMGTQGRTGLNRWLAGSVAEEVLRKSTCPVLAVKAPPFMPVPHARPGEIVDVRPFGADLLSTKTNALVKTKDVEVIRMVVPAGKEIPMHQVKGELIVQCLEGRIEFTAVGRTQILETGRIFYLPKHEAHSIKGLEDASLLVTILLPK
jgi:nucleotide-binding universal stress UspA family protein/quercetin dioxygenase-like cupin family protein